MKLESATKRRSDEATQGNAPLSAPSSLRRSVAPSLIQNNLPTPEGRCHISDDSVAFSARDALIGGDDPADVHPLGGRGKSAAKAFTADLRGFTLIEILIVIGIIVLLIALAIPAFNAISGSRSVDAAANTVSAFVGRARLEAIGLQETRGVMFFIDPVSQESKVAIVRTAPRPGLNGNEKGMSAATIDLYLDLASDTDFLTIPPGVGIQFVDDCTFDTSVNPKARRDDGFLGFNGVDPSTGNPLYYQSAGGNASTTTVVTNQNQALSVRPGGVILFDAQGRLVCSTYAFKTRLLNTGGNFEFTPMGKRLFTTTNSEADARVRLPSVAGVADVIPWQAAGPGAPRSIRSQVGFVLYDKATFESRQYTLSDPQMTNIVYTTDATEPGEESWLDENSTVYLVNRYNGTLVKGE